MGAFLGIFIAKLLDPFAAVVALMFGIFSDRWWHPFAAAAFAVFIAVCVQGGSTSPRFRYTDEEGRAAIASGVAEPFNPYDTYVDEMWDAFERMGVFPPDWALDAFTFTETRREADAARAYIFGRLADEEVLSRAGMPRDEYGREVFRLCAAFCAAFTWALLGMLLRRVFRRRIAKPAHQRPPAV